MYLGGGSWGRIRVHTIHPSTSVDPQVPLLVSIILCRRYRARMLLQVVVGVDLLLPLEPKMVWQVTGVTTHQPSSHPSRIHPPPHLQLVPHHNNNSEVPRRLRALRQWGAVSSTNFSPLEPPCHTLVAPRRIPISLDTLAAITIIITLLAPR